MIDLDLSALKQWEKFAAFTFGSSVTKDSLYFCESKLKGFALLRNVPKVHSDVPKLLRN